MVSRKIVGLAAAAGIAALTGWLLVTRAQQRPAVVRSAPLDAHRTLGTPSAFRNLTVFPVFDSSSGRGDAYATLDEGLKAGKVKVKESSDGGSVNTLYVTNSGRKPLYLMAGEVVLGGQQDRTLAQDTIVAPGKTNVPITVFCVEHGRWSGRAEFDHSAPTVAALDIRASAMNGEFNAVKAHVAARSAGSPGAAINNQAAPALEGRQAYRSNRNVNSNGAAFAGDEVAKAQQKVWDGVAEKNRKFKIQNQTGTYRDALTMKSGDAQKSVPAYVKALSGRLGSDPHLVGVVAAVNGNIIAADIFSEPALFRKLWPKLLRSYAADAVEKTDGAGKSTGKKVTLTAANVMTFMANVKNEKLREENDTEDGRRIRYDSKEASVYSLLPETKAAGAATKPLHESILRK